MLHLDLYTYGKEQWRQIGSEMYVVYLSAQVNRVYDDIMTPKCKRSHTDVNLRPGHTGLYGWITAKTRLKVVSREADEVIRAHVEFKTSYSRFMDVAGRGGKSERRRTWQKVLNCSKFYPADNHGRHTW